MPNHVENIISLSGSEQEIQQMLKRIKSDMFGVGTVDFEKIIPMQIDQKLRRQIEEKKQLHGLKMG